MKISKVYKQTHNKQTNKQVTQNTFQITKHTIKEVKKDKGNNW